jgi:tRNA threonylcarbamoyladenosine biosynthesis protein TsaB
MFILAIETTAKTGTLAAADGHRIVLEKQLDPAQRSAQSLAPAIACLLSELAWQPKEIGLVAVAAGPGSFTGLRVGVTTAKVFAYAIGAAVIGVNALEAVAVAAPDDVSRIETVIDAQRGDVLAQCFARDGLGVFRPEAGSRLVPLAVWAEQLSASAVVSGPGLEKLPANVPPHVRLLPPELWHPQAANVARIAFREFSAGRRDDLWALLPVYSRRAAAEEQWEKRGL